MRQLFEAVARVGALLVVYHTDTDIRVWRKVEGEGGWRTHVRMYTDHDGVESCFISTDGACSAPPEPLPWARGEVTGLARAYLALT